jgi:hypothetical protein
MIIQANIVGISFRTDEAFNTLRPSGQIELVRNPYICEEDPDRSDELACEVWYTDKNSRRIMLGFLKKGSYAQTFAAENPEVKFANIKDYCYAEEPNAANPKWNKDHRGRLASMTIILTDGDDDVVFDEDGNYIIGGVSYMRLTKVLSHFDFSPGDTGLLRWQIEKFNTYYEYFNELNRLSSDGTKLHRAIQNYINSGFKTVDPLLPKDANGNNAIDEFFKKYQVEIIETEKTVASKLFGIAGTLDFVCTLVPKKGAKRIKVVIDWKSAKAMRKKMRYQVAWYAEMVGADEGWVVTFGGTQKCGYGRSVVQNVGAGFKSVCLIKRSIDACREFEG